MKFDIGGMKIGDGPTADLLERYGSQFKEGKPHIECNELSKVDGQDLFVTYKFHDGKLASVGILFGAPLYAQILQNYVDKFGTPHEMSNDTYNSAIWTTDAGNFTLSRRVPGTNYGGGQLWTEYDQRLADEKKQETSATLKGKL